MKPANRVMIVAGLICAAQACVAAPHPNIPQMVHDSTLIVIANVGQVKYVGRTRLVINGRVFWGGKYQAEAMVLYSLKGSSPGQLTINLTAQMVSRTIGLSNWAPGYFSSKTQHPSTFPPPRTTQTSPR